MIVCPACGMSTWEDRVGCALPGCINHNVLVKPPEYFDGHSPRRCGDHRTVGPDRAWCFDCSEWCYPNPELACAGCGPSREELEARIERYRLAWLSARRRAIRIPEDVADAIQNDPGPEWAPDSPDWGAGYSEAQRDMADVARGFNKRVMEALDALEERPTFTDVELPEPEELPMSSSALPAGPYTPEETK